MPPGPQQRRQAQLPPPERFPVAIKAPFVSAWGWSWSRRRRDWEGRGKRQPLGAFPGGDFAAAGVPPSSATAFFPYFFSLVPGPSLSLHLYSLPSLD